MLPPRFIVPETRVLSRRSSGGILALLLQHLLVPLVADVEPPPLEWCHLLPLKEREPNHSGLELLLQDVVEIRC